MMDFFIKSAQAIALLILLDAYPSDLRLKKGGMTAKFFS